MSDQIDWTGGPEPKKKPGRRRGVREAREAPADVATHVAGANEPGADAPAPESRLADAAAHDLGLQEAAACELPTEPTDGPVVFPGTETLVKKGLRVLPVVTGAVVDASGTFLFYLDGHDDGRAGVQAQLNHQLGSGPSREEHLASARSRAHYLVDRLAKPR